MACRYGFLLPKSHISQEDPLSICVAILHQFGIPSEMYQVGITKLFFRAGQVRSLHLLFKFIHIRNFFGDVVSITEVLLLSTICSVHFVSYVLSFSSSLWCFDLLQYAFCTLCSPNMLSKISAPWCPFS